MSAEWREIPGFPGYLVSDDGQVASTKRGSLRLLSQQELHAGHRQVWLYTGSHKSRSGIQVHRLVLLAFVGPAPDGHEACHRNDVANDNRLANLYWGTRADNMQDRLRNGGNPFVKRTHCPRGHEYTPENTRVYNGCRSCKECQRIRVRLRDARRREARRATGEVAA